MRAFLLVVLAGVACGGDDPPTNKPAAPKAAPAPAPAPGAPPMAGSGKPLPVKRHAENKIQCPVPRADAKKCDPNATRPVQLGDKPYVSRPDDLLCADNEVCTNTSIGYLCGPCPERFAIRHEFKDRDFAVENNRDPFQSFIVKVPGTGSGSDGIARDPTSRCVRAQQLRVTNYGFQDLKLVGIVSQGTRRKVLMMDPGNYGHIVKQGDCVGKEKAWVKYIGDNSVCFEPTSDPNANQRMPEGICVELHTKQLGVTQLPNAGPPTAPTVNPVNPAPVPAQGSAAPQGRTITTTTIQTPAPAQPQPPQAPQAPTNLKP